MKYVDKFPDMKYIDEEQDGVIRGRTQRSCCVCGWETEFVEINYEAPFCSESVLLKWTGDLMQKVLIQQKSIDRSDSNDDAGSPS